MSEPSLSADEIRKATEALEPALGAFSARYPGEAGGRQPVHTVYGGAHLFRADTAQKLGAMAARAFDEYAPDAATFAAVLGLPGAEALAKVRDVPLNLGPFEDDTLPSIEPSAVIAHLIRSRVVDKLAIEPIEDYRIDFEDGYGVRPDAEEDEHATRAAREVAKGLKDESLPPFLGIRVKPLGRELGARSVRTLDLFLTTLVREAGTRLPDGFVVTLPKVVIPEQVAALAALLTTLERRLGISEGTIKIELMVEAAQSLIGPGGEVALPRLVAPARERMVALHFGAYDYTASCNITAGHQHMLHPACDLARHLMQISMAGTGIWLSDGATNVLPIPPYRKGAGEAALAERQIEANRRVVHRAWKMHYDHIQHALRSGFYQGWDLHPAQIPIRYAAIYAFFLSGIDLVSERLRNFVKTAAQATRVGEVFDDAATGQGLLNFFLRAMSSRAISEEEAMRRTALSLDELRSRSFMKILEARSSKT